MNAAQKNIKKQIFQTVYPFSSPMTTSPILFFTKKSSFSLPKPAAVSQWLEQVAAKEGKQLEQLSYIFCSDDYLHAMNVRYLGHDTLTDVITFDQSEQEGVIEGDVYISIDRVHENAQTYKVTFLQELHRVRCMVSYT